MNIESLSTVVAWALIGLGFFSIFLPIAPSIPVLWLGMFVYAASHSFEVITKPFMATVSAIAVGTIFLDYTLFHFGMQKFRAGAWEVVGAIIGFAIGSFFGQFYALVVGPALGGVIFALMRGRDQIYSFKTGNTTVVAFLGGTIVKLIAAVIMIGLFVLRIRENL